MIIYKHTCLITQESYIGLTKYTIEARNQGHLRAVKYGCTYKFPNAIRMHGWENFITEILEKDISNYETLQQREIYWIAFFDTFRSGLNMTIGGEGRVGPQPKEAIEKMITTRTTIQQDGLTSYQTGGRKRADTVKPYLQDIVDKTAQTRRERGDFLKMSESQMGIQIGYMHTCEHCNKNVQGGNFTRWHGDNCKMNPNITEEQLLKREPYNKSKEPKKLKQLSENKIYAYDIINKVCVKIEKSIFDKLKNIQYVGFKSKQNPNAKVSDETKKKLSDKAKQRTRKNKE